MLSSTSTKSWGKALRGRGPCRLHPNLMFLAAEHVPQGGAKYTYKMFPCRSNSSSSSLCLLTLMSIWRIGTSWLLCDRQRKPENPIAAKKLKNLPFRRTLQCRYSERRQGSRHPHCCHAEAVICGCNPSRNAAHDT